MIIVSVCQCVIIVRMLVFDYSKSVLVCDYRECVSMCDYSDYMLVIQANFPVRNNGHSDNLLYKLSQINSAWCEQDETGGRLVCRMTFTTTQGITAICWLTGIFLYFVSLTRKIYPIISTFASFRGFCRFQHASMDVDYYERSSV